MTAAGPVGVLVDAELVARASRMIRRYAEDLEYRGYDPVHEGRVARELHDAYVAATGQEP